MRPCLGHNKLFVWNIIIWGKVQKEHDEHSEDVLPRAQKRNLKLILHKCKIGVNEVKYMVHIFSEKNIQPDCDEIKAIVN